MSYKVLFDGNGSGIIQVVGLGLFVPAEKHNEVMQKWEQAQAERDELAFNMAEHERLHSELNEILHPDGGAPEKPSLCDLVSYVKSDRDALAALVGEFKKIRSDWDGMAINDAKTLIAFTQLADKAPQQCLRNVQAEAGRLGFLEGVRQMCDNEIGWFGHDAEACSKHYAAKARQGGAK